MKFILNESKFMLPEKYLFDERYILQEARTLIEKIDATTYPNIIKFYPEAAAKDSSWATAKLPDVSKYDKYMKKRLNNYFAAEWITKEHCDALIIAADDPTNPKQRGTNFSEADKLYKKFETEAKETARLFAQILESLTNTKTKIPDYYEKLKSELLDLRESAKADLDEFHQVITAFKPTVEGSSDPTTLYTKLKSLIPQIENTKFFKTTKNTDVKTAVENLKDLGNLDITSPETQQTLKQKTLDPLQVLIQKSIDLKEEALEALLDTTIVENLKATTEELIKLLPKCETVIQDEKKEKKVLSVEALTVFHDLITPLAAFVAEDITAENVVQKVEKSLDTFKTFIQDATASLKKIIETSGISVDRSHVLTTSTEDEESTLSSTDWDREFRNSIDKESFWPLYVKKAWPGQEAKINAILKALKLECTTYGFKEELNPFLNYIKKYYLNTSYDMLPQAYFAVHDAVVRQYIKATDLTPTKNNLSVQDIIFCKNFARKSGKDAIDYLSLQKDLLKAISAIKFDSEALSILKQNLGEEIFATKNDENKKKLHFAIMYEVGDLAKVDTRITNYDTDPRELKLRPHQDIQLLIKQLGGDVTQAITDPQIDTYVLSLKDKDTAVEAFLAIALQYLEKPTTFISKYQETKNMVSVAIKELMKTKASLEKLGTVNESHAIKILDKIAQKYKFTKA